MVDEHQVINLAYKLWEEEGRPEGKHLDQYFSARRMLEDQETKKSPSLDQPLSQSDLPSGKPLKSSKPRTKKGKP